MTAPDTVPDAAPDTVPDGVPAGRPVVGILLVTAATLCFALADVATKYLTMQYPVPVVAAGRYVVSLVLLLVVLYPRNRAGLWKTRRTGLVVLRGLVLTLASLTMGHALRHMPVGETVAIMYLSPFAVLLLSAPLLGERVSTAGWLAAALGFAGVMLILRPGNGLDPVGVAFALTNACCATCYFLLTRLLTRTETTHAMLFHVTLAGALIFSVLALGSLDIAPPRPIDLGYMALLGLFATLGHFLVTSAYREAPASLLAPVNYLHLVWAAGLGWVVFMHVPDWVSMTGMGLVCASGAGLALFSHRQGRRARRDAELAAARAPEAP